VVASGQIAMSGRPRPVGCSAACEDRTRSAITLALLTALRCDDELAVHVRAARTNGLTTGEIGEVLHHTAVYAGIPGAAPHSRLPSKS